MTVIDEYLANNARYAENFSGPLPMPPAKGVAIVACMDARLNVYGLLGLNEGEAHAASCSTSRPASSTRSPDPVPRLRRVARAPEWPANR